MPFSGGIFFRWWRPLPGTHNAAASMPGGDVTQHFVRALWQHADLSKASIGLLFVDLSSAFASLAQELAFTQSQSPEAITHIAARFGLPTELAQQFIEYILGPDAPHLACVGAHLRQLIAQAHVASWFTVQGASEPSSVFSGSKAGDPLGDVLFAVVVTRLLNRIADRLLALGLQLSLSLDSAAPLLAPPRFLRRLSLCSTSPTLMT